MQTGLIYCDTNNIGDDIQSYAVSLLMPIVDHYIPREKVSEWTPKCKAVIAGWYKHRVMDWPPHENITPLFLAFHASDQRCVTQHHEYLSKCGPIGCRDLATVELCRQHGLDAYFSGCATLTLKPLDVPGNGKPLFIDVPSPPDIAHNRGDVGINVTRPGERLQKARERLELFAASRCVITSRLHVALPCAAMGVPVLLIPPANDSRFTGLLDYVNVLEVFDEHAIRQFIESPLENPNPGRRLEIADVIRRRICEFYGEPPMDPSMWKIKRKASIEQAEGTFSITAEQCAYEIGPIHLHGDSSKFAPYKPVKTLPASGVVELKNAGVLGNSGWVVDSAGQLIVGLSWYGDEMADRVELDKMPITSRRRIQGRALNLASMWSTANYGHCLMESIGRLSIAEAAGWRLTDFDYIVMPYFGARDIERFIDRLGIERSKLIHRLNPSELLVFEELIAPTINGLTRTYRSELAVWARKRILYNAPTGFGRRLFIHRNTTSRAIKNSNEIIRIAEAFGFEILDPVATPNSFIAFAQAECIAGTHQAALANLMFAAPGSRFLELLPTSHQYLYYQSMAHSAGLEYHCLLADSDDYSDGRFSPWPSTAPVYVNPEHFEKALMAITRKGENFII